MLLVLEMVVLVMAGGSIQAGFTMRQSRTLPIMVGSYPTSTFTFTPSLLLNSHHAADTLLETVNAELAVGVGDDELDDDDEDEEEESAEVKNTSNSA